MQLRRLKPVLGIGAAVLAVWVLIRFPWSSTAAVLASASLSLLALAALLNLASLAAKGWAWWSLFPREARPRWRGAVAATLVGAAASAITISVSGEAVRLHWLAREDGRTMLPGLAPLLQLRGVEALALLPLLPAFFALTPLPPGLPDGLRTGVLILLLLVAALAAALGPLRRYLPARLARGLAALALSPRRLPAPFLLALLNWLLQWGSYAAVIQAAHLAAPVPGALAALIFSNLGGLLRLTPANVGVLQGAMVLGLLPFGVTPALAVGAGLLLQAVQVLPVLAVGAALGARVLPWPGRAPAPDVPGLPER